MQPDVYLFGQILGTHSFLLRDGFLQPDEYAEIEAKYFLPGGGRASKCAWRKPLFCADEMSPAGRPRGPEGLI